MTMATKSKRGTVYRGTLQSLIRANGDWMAIVVQFSAAPGNPVWSSIVPISELKGSARKKADRWVEYLS